MSIELMTVTDEPPAGASGALMPTMLFLNFRPPISACEPARHKITTSIINYPRKSRYAKYNGALNNLCNDTAR